MIADLVTGIAAETWNLLAEMAPYLLFGFFAAGILKVIIPGEKIFRHLSGDNLSSVIKAAVFGIPLPLCSCGVIPVAAHLRNQGAGKSSTISFLISTPTTGIDSIMATYSLLGIIFVIVRIVAALCAALIAGIMISLFDRHPSEKSAATFACSTCGLDTPHRHSASEILSRIFRYAFYDLVHDTWKWLAIGIIAGGFIMHLLPADIAKYYLGNPFISYPLMLLIGIPMYTCATGSIPVAASLILKGMSPGAGLVFLIAGPATNTATMSFVGGKLGKKSLLIYTVTIAVSSLGFGLLLDYYISPEFTAGVFHDGMRMLPEFLKTISSFILIVLVIITFLTGRRQVSTDIDVTIEVTDMTCNHCAQTITNSLKETEGIEHVTINLKSKTVNIKGKASREKIIKAVSDAGFTVKE